MHFSHCYYMTLIFLLKYPNMESKIMTNIFRRSIFLDTSNLEEVKKWNALGVIDGVTTNPTSLFNDGVNIKEINKVVRMICKEMGKKPVSVQLTDSNSSVKEMIDQAKKLDSIAANIVVKVPLIPETTKTLEVVHALSSLNIAVNVTAIMTYEQMVIATLATRNCKRASFISLFWGRSMEDQVKYRGRFDYMADHKRVGLESTVNSHPKNIVAHTLSFLQEGEYENPKIIIGSIRTATQAGEAFAAGTHIVTISPEILLAMLFSQRTIETLDQFDTDWKKLQEKK